MAPTKAVSRPLIPQLTGRVSTRSKSNNILAASNKLSIGSKRKADGSPCKETAVKRSAFGDVTNAVSKNIDDKGKGGLKENVGKKVTVQAKVLPSLRSVLKQKQNENVAPPQAQVKIQTRASLRAALTVPNEITAAAKAKEVLKDASQNGRNKTRLSNDFEKTEESLYSSALEDISNSASSSASKKSTKDEMEKRLSVTVVVQQMESALCIGNHVVPPGVQDFDKENWNDVFQISEYAMDIFNYLKTREEQFTPDDYMERQVCLTRWMRSLLVDWMVEIQESFELNHETLYLGVKLVDLYLSKITCGKDTLQLVGAAAMFIASKYDERVPPQVEDFLYICDGAYDKGDFLRMEINLLKIIGFDLGIPLSYRFLRRYARCAKVTMPVLTLARFILEHSLMDYETIRLSDSKLAAASLYLALRMKNFSTWTATLEHYTGYSLDEIKSVVLMLNQGLHKKPKEQLMTVRNKYSHEIFFAVAKTPLIPDEQL